MDVIIAVVRFNELIARDVLVDVVFLLRLIVRVLLLDYMEGLLFPFEVSWIVPYSFRNHVVRKQIIKVDYLRRGEGTFWLSRELLLVVLVRLSAELLISNFASTAC